MIKRSAFLAVLYLLIEDFPKIFDQRNNKQPTILCRGAEIKFDDINLLEVLTGDSFAIMVEDCHIAFTPDLIHAFGIIIELRYVFNLTYAVQTQTIMVFIQKLMFNLADSYRASTKVLILIAKTRKNNLD